MVAEAEAVDRVAAGACPLRVVLERVVATSSGAVLALWQVAGGTDPAALRAALAAALPQASRQQAIRDRQILHTTLARIVKLPPGAAAGSGDVRSDRRRRRRGLARHSYEAAAAEAVRQAVERMTAELCGLEATLGMLWFVEERDKLALALDGSFTKRTLPLRCEAQQRGQALDGGQHAATKQIGQTKQIDER